MAERATALLGLVFPLIMAGFVRPDVTKGLRMLKANLEGAGGG
jgi:hypothetical protein